MCASTALAYYIEWEDIQQVITLSGDCGIDLTANLGEAESRGAELELLGGGDR
ncbi:MAG: hypothetical protein U5K56_04685 [Halioglobus sp.]|nr:hypothetical protein [Halioglobus sp.]